ncbi:MAG: hypothetical protein Q8760_02535, partial [Candidatus Phytoplasma australasiaticum]|nr:hypothetical protein [Candidatus Phytoplasma australasiaticum]
KSLTINTSEMRTEDGKNEKKVKKNKKNTPKLRGGQNRLKNCFVEIKGKVVKNKSTYLQGFLKVT